MEDITERKKAEEALKKAKDDLEVRVMERTKELAISNESLHKEIIEHKADEEKIKASLKEKEVLLKEIHHRVKNNLQIVSSLLDLQSMNVKDKDYVDMLKDSQNRIRTMALIHEKLYQSEDLAMINLSEYIKNLTLYLHRSYAANSSGVEVNIDVDDVFLNIDAAIPIGLIINELVSNSYKHAFPNGKKGEIFVKFHKNGNGEYLLEVGDNGVGIPDSFSLENATSLGLQLVNILAKENGRSIDVDRNNGTKFSIAFSNKAAVNI
jgi:two-component sensor histidine kinase